ncbi:MAG: hypothetical protein ACLQGT_01105 [Terracidiphilus sp.]
MKVRELLQIELWRKETSRKVLRRIWRVLKPVAIALGLLLVLLFVSYEVEIHWLTSGERQAGKVALAQVEKLETLSYCRCEQFAVANKEATNAVQNVRSKAWTLRDRGLVEWLELYRWQVETENVRDMREAENVELVARRHLQLHMDPQFEGKHRELQNETFRQIRGILHQLLD